MGRHASRSACSSADTFAAVSSSCLAFQKPVSPALMTMRVAEAMLARSRDRIEYARVVMLIPDCEGAVVLDAILDTECMWPVGVGACVPRIPPRFIQVAPGDGAVFGTGGGQLGVAVTPCSRGRCDDGPCDAALATLSLGTACTNVRLLTNDVRVWEVCFAVWALLLRINWCE